MRSHGTAPYYNIPVRRRMSVKTKTDDAAAPVVSLTSSDRLRVWGGDIGHVATLISTVVFASCVVAFLGNNSSNNNDDDNDNRFFFFDREWQREGFCVTNRNQPVLSSHAICLYVDLAFALLMAALYWPYRHRVELQHANLLISMNALGTIGHGIAHGAIAYHMMLSQSSGEDHDTKGDVVAEQQVKDEAASQLDRLVFPVLIWLPLMKATLPNAPLAVVAVSAWVANGVVTSLPSKMGFAAVQTILLVAFSLNQLLRPRVEKMDLHYSLFAWMVSFPVTLVGWMESTQCTAFVRNALYGHVVYDAYISLSAIAFYMLCIRNANHQQQQQTKQKSA
jgi:hypothetical protein